MRERRGRAARRLLERLRREEREGAAAERAREDAQRLLLLEHLKGPREAPAPGAGP